MRKVGQDILDRARAGDARAFRELVEPYRHELQVHCYRILGSLTDAEDLLQETLLAAWRGLDGYAGRASVRSWLYRIATNRCLNALRDAGRRVPAEPSPPFTPTEPTRRTEVTWLQPAPDDPAAQYSAKETFELAFVAALQKLPPRQAAVLLLRDVLDYSTAEVADMLETSSTAVKGALQRARAQLRQTVEPAPPAPREREIAQRFADAFSEGDVDGVVALLTDDGWLAMPPAPHEYVGREAVTAFLAMFGQWRGTRRFRLLPTRANTHPAFACYLTEPDGTVGHPAGILVLALWGDRIRTVTWFLEPELFPRFGLPAEVKMC
ncbi:MULTISPECIES: RNA polymerase subunit sigma-70 [unclassified Amycolatopsis]|uniref:RNA polymerase subunit sigma-70 n=1 Tax=unclassified Amycolatopsis TaxID=2618356 RepID=UPI001F104059|nr:MULTISPECIES: RNA polymerase subunit sigma-70 [unclassified Amycolatopsis]